jgi:UDP-glucose 4-epimerase
MKVAITGINSYLASELLPFLENDDEIEKILGIDITKPAFKSKKITFIKDDIRSEGLFEDLKGFDALIHLAFIVSPLKNIREMYSINIDGSKNIFYNAIKAGISKIIHASSVAAYGSFQDNPIPITEEHPIRLMDKKYYYHETKYRVERCLDTLEDEYSEITVIRMRPHVFLGPKINNVMKNMFSGEKIISFFPDHLVQYVWAKDVAQAFYLALKKDISGTFNLGGDNPLAMREIAERLDKKILNLPYRLSLFLANLTYKLHLQRSLDPGWIRMAKYPIIVDSTKAKEVLNWRPKYDTWETISAFVKYLESVEND